jgi:AGZA family xanthine/uracil permease-like MFS transporter
MMMTAVAEIAWAVFLTMMCSIANGLAFGFCSYTLVRICRGRFREVNWMVYVLTALFLARFYWI